MRALALMPLALLLACKSEPSFDERYEAAEKQIREKAKAIDAELEHGAKDLEDAPYSAPPSARDEAS